MEKMIKCEIDGHIREYERGTKLLEISKEYQKNYENDIMLAFVDGKLRELIKPVIKDCKISFLTTKDDVGHKTYIRGISLMMLKAMYQEFGRDNVNRICIEFSLGNALYYEVEGNVKLDQEILDRVKARMNTLVEKDIPFRKFSMNTEEAMDLFAHYGMYDKQKLFKYRRVSRANIYNLDGFEDYYYGYMPASTGVLKYFDLTIYEDGFIMILPYKNTPTHLNEFVPTPKLYRTLKASNDWGRKMGIDTVGALNDEICRGGASQLILVQEALQEKKIGEIAAQIVSQPDKKFIMIAGPSSSGKTTFSHRLSIQLRTFGLNPHPIAVDDYFCNREDTPRDEFGNYNYECLEAIDTKQFNQDMMNLLAGKKVELPSFNFKTGKREYKGNYKKLGPDDILVIEGIHGLNDKLSYSLPKESKFKIYISALTQLNIDEHNRIPTTDGRLLRRMVRDARTRGTSAKDTIAMWSSVRRGEEKYIFPFQEEADIMFNSVMIYELAVLKQFAEPILFGIPREAEEYIEAKRLLKFLDYFVGISSEDVPNNSILREFIGGSCFNV